MLSWVMNRGGPAPSGASPDADDTLADQPDTPAPVFAARALKSAIFGTPATAKPARAPPAKKESKQPAESRPPVPSKPPLTAMPISTPSKQPQGILLTPGVGTARRKRVSFGNDVPAADRPAGSRSSRSPEESALVAKPGEGADGLDPDSMPRPRTSLTERLEKSRQLRPKSQDLESYTRPSNASSSQAKAGTVNPAWEEAAPDECDNDNEPEYDGDMTVDLNEPHSRSGRYWKSEYQRYHDEARAEMEKLVKYKQLAKEYAKSKDAEAMRLKEVLSKEQAKVAEMEAKVGELTRQIATRRINGGKNADTDVDVVGELAKQTALVTQYRGQVKELEAVLKGGEDKGSGDLCDGKAQRMVSPQTSRTLMETQRQLKRARDQVQELIGLKDEHRKLKADLRAAEKRMQELETATETAKSELATTKMEVKELTAKLTLMEDRARRKTDALEKLQKDYDKLREDSRRTAREAKEAMREKDEEISRLKKLLEKKTSDVLVASEKASEDLNPPYAVNAANADWTMDVTQLGDVEARQSTWANGRRTEKRAKEPEPEPEITADSSGWFARLEQMDKDLKSAPPMYDEEPIVSRPARNPGTGHVPAAAKPGRVDKTDFSQVLNLMQSNMRALNVFDPDKDAARLAQRDAPRAAAAAAAGPQEKRRKREPSPEDSGLLLSQDSPIADRYRARLRSGQRLSAAVPPPARISQPDRRRRSALVERRFYNDNFTFEVDGSDFTKRLGKPEERMLA